MARRPRGASTSRLTRWSPPERRSIGTCSTRTIGGGRRSSDRRLPKRPSFRWPFTIRSLQASSRSAPASSKPALTIPFRRVRIAHRAFVSVLRSEDRYELPDDDLSLTRTAVTSGMEHVLGAHVWLLDQSGGWHRRRRHRRKRARGAGLGRERRRRPPPTCGSTCAALARHHVVAIRGGGGVSNGDPRRRPDVPAGRVLGGRDRPQLRCRRLQPAARFRDECVCRAARGAGERRIPLAASPRRSAASAPGRSSCTRFTPRCSATSGMPGRAASRSTI